MSSMTFLPASDVQRTLLRILVAGSGVSPAPLTNSTSGVTIILPSGSEPEYTLMTQPVPRDVLSNTVDTIIGCTTGSNQEDNRFSMS